MDISQELPNRVYNQVSNRIISRTVVYEDLPMYCSCCYRLGHMAAMCNKDQIEKPTRDNTLFDKSVNLSAKEHAHVGH